jgi:DHA1 family inner membrane transport protein
MSTTSETTAQALPAPSARLDRRILALSFAGFATGTEAYVYAGHLATLAGDLQADLALAGQLATAFALTYALTAPLIAGAVVHLPRRAVIATGLVLIGALNLAAAAMPALGGLLVLRVLCGLAAGLVGPAASVAAAELAGPAARGRAMAAVLGGTTVAFVVGIPMGSAVGAWFGWRATFGYAGLLALLAALVVRLVLPDLPGSRRAGAQLPGVVRQPGMARPLAMTLVGFAATFCVIAYIGPVVTAIADLEGAGVGAMQALIGLGSIAGIVAGARAADRSGGTRLIGLSFLISAAALLSYTVLLWAGLPYGISLPALALGTLAGSAALFARMPVIQARLVAAAAPEARPVALALNGSMVFAGQGLGAAIGGATIGAFGLTAVGIAGALLALGGALLADTRSAPGDAAPVAEAGR